MRSVIKYPIKLLLYSRLTYMLLQNIENPEILNKPTLTIFYVDSVHSANSDIVSPTKHITVTEKNNPVRACTVFYYSSSTYSFVLRKILTTIT